MDGAAVDVDANDAQAALLVLLHVGGRDERVNAPAGGAVEPVNVGTLFIGDEDTAAVPGHANALRVEARIIGIGGGRFLIEIVRTPGEISADDAEAAWSMHPLTIAIRASGLENPIGA